LAACENDEKKVDALSKKRITVDEGIRIESFFSSDGKVKARLTAPVMRNYQTDSPYIEFPKTLHVDFYNDSTRVIETRLDARYGKYRENEKKVFLKDSVTVYNVSGDTLRSMELWWDQQRREFYTDKPARIYRKDGTHIYGKDGLTAAQDFSEVIFHTASGIAPRPADGTF
jgi:LPS export ABC transporter protein LptC